MLASELLNRKQAKGHSPSAWSIKQWLAFADELSEINDGEQHYRHVKLFSKLFKIVIKQ